jgi:hypothetical protein
MPRIVTSIHDSIALRSLCARLSLPEPHEGAVYHETDEVFGWLVRLPGVRHVLAFNTLTGLVAYHPEDGAFHRYARIMRFIYRCYEAQARRRMIRRPRRMAVA